MPNRRTHNAAQETPPYPSLLAAVLAEKGWSQYRLVRETGLSNATVTAIYHGRPFQFETAVRIAKVLDVPLARIAPELVEHLDGLAVN